MGQIFEAGEPFWVTGGPFGPPVNMLAEALWRSRKHLRTPSGLPLAGATRTRWWCLLWRSNIIRQRVTVAAVAMVKARMKQADASKQLSVSGRSVSNMTVSSSQR